MTIAIKRVYEPSSRSDGYRVLVDGLWPRGLAKQQAGVDLWLKEIAPSRALRQWFDHDPARWRGFRARYTRELDARAACLEPLLARARRGRVTLLFASKEERFNNAVALREYLEGRLRRSPRGPGGGPLPAP
jgi:uncharacterized protein YeaO (DUF488 family)